MNRPAFQPARAHGIKLFTANDPQRPSVATRLDTWLRARSIRKLDARIHALADQAVCRYAFYDDKKTARLIARVRQLQARRDALAAGAPYVPNYVVRCGFIAIPVLVWGGVYFLTT